ncbi:MAG: hypothetical protein SGI72_10840 [Planctomycetota bacterium]|nr:hypothetical protein [Planctomycetota bacterium]
MEPSEQPTSASSARAADRYLTHAARPTRSLRNHCALACGVGLWLACAAVDATIATHLDEPLVLRLARRWAQHPVRVVVAGSLSAWAFLGLCRGVPAVTPPNPDD